MSDLRLSSLSLEELYAAEEIIRRIDGALAYNQARAEYYEAHRDVKNLSISVPKSFRDVKIAVGWPGIVVDAMDERLNIRGAIIPGEDIQDFGIDGIIADNNLETVWQDSHIDALVQGIAFETVTLGDTSLGEPEVLITVEAPTTMSGIWNERRRSLDAAGAVVRDKENIPIAFTLFLRDQIIKLVKVDKKWVVEERQAHHLGRPPVRRLPNRTRSSRQWGRSEITRPIISATDSAARTLLGAELARELYGAPTRVIIDATEKYFKDSLGNPSKAWSAYMGRFLALPRDEMNDQAPSPRIEQLSGSTPTPYIEMVKMYSQMVAGEAALPPTYMGFVTENPASADQIRAVEARHVKRAERRQQVFGAAHRGALLDAVAMRDGNNRAADALKSLKISWYDAATPTKAASADAMSKQVAAGVIPARSRIALEGLGYDELQIKQIEADWRVEDARERARSILAPLAQQARESDAEVSELVSKRS